MSEEESQDWLTMKRVLEQYLSTVERQLTEFAADGTDDEYDFLTEKAVSYRDIISGINELLNLNKP